MKLRKLAEDKEREYKTIISQYKELKAKLDKIKHQKNKNKSKLELMKKSNVMLKTLICKNIVKKY